MIIFGTLLSSLLDKIALCSQSNNKKLFVELEVPTTKPLTLVKRSHNVLLDTHCFGFCLHYLAWTLMGKNEFASERRWCMIQSRIHRQG